MTRSSKFFVEECDFVWVEILGVSDLSWLSMVLLEKIVVLLINCSSGTKINAYPRLGDILSVRLGKFRRLTVFAPPVTSTAMGVLFF